LTEGTIPSLLSEHSKRRGRRGKMERGRKEQRRLEQVRRGPRRVGNAT